MTTSEQARADHECSACGGTGREYGLSGHPASGGHPTCLVCLGSSRISDRMPIADALADAETLRRYLRANTSRYVWRHRMHLSVDWRTRGVDVVTVIRAAREAFRAVPGLRGAA